MKLSMLIPLLVVSTGFIATAQEADPDKSIKPLALAPSEEDSRGVLIEVDGVGSLEVRVEVVDSSVGRWKSLTTTPEFTQKGKREIERTGNYVFTDGSSIEHHLTAKIEGASVLVNAEWPNSSTAKGFARADLWIPQDLADDLLLENDGSPVKLREQGSTQVKNPGVLVFRRASDGEFLFRLEGEKLFAVVKNDSATGKGWTIRLSAVDDRNTSIISTATAMNWLLGFEE